MFGSDCTAALALTLAAMEWEALAWVAAAPEGESRWAGTLTRDLSHWTDYGTESASDLAAYLWACDERERQKELRRNGGYTDAEMDAYEAEWAAERAALDALQAEADEAARLEAEEAARFAIWDYDVDHTGRVRFAA